MADLERFKLSNLSWDGDKDEEALFDSIFVLSDQESISDVSTA